MKKALTFAAALVALGALPAAAQAGTWTLANPTPIVMPDNSPASPYPSPISVQNLPGNVTKVTATLHGIGHGSGGDIDIAAVGPGGQNVLLMSESCIADMSGARDLSFDDAAPTNLPNLGPSCVAGTYKPTEGGGADTFPAPGPAAPFGAALSAFNGGSPNGTWSLYAVDDNAGVAGGIAGGWSLTITTTDDPAQGISSSCAGRPGTIFGTLADDEITGTDGDDVIVGFDGRDVIRGLGGKDVICGNDGKDKLVGGAGNDRLLGENGKDRLLGGKGKDVLKGGKGKDVLKGGKGKDKLKGGKGKDKQIQ